MISLWILVILAIGYLVYRQLFSKPTLSGRLPPGPKPLPIIGNLRDLPPAGKPEHEHWLKHKDLYGPVSSVTVLGRQIIILHSREAIQELMEKTSLKTSGRPALEFGYMCGYDEYFSLHQYTETFRLNRKFVHKQLGTKELILRYQGVLETEVAHLLLRALETPQHLIQHFRSEAAAAIIKIAYGYTIEPNGVDPLVKLIDHEMANVSTAFIPLAWAVDILPVLRYMPEWFPGGSFHKTARLWKRVHKAVINIPYDFVMERVKNGTDKSNYVSRNMEEAAATAATKTAQGYKEPPVRAEEVDAIKASAAAIYAGGSDTTVATLTSFVLAMIKFPHVQREAQREIDALTGGDRLPGFADREKLPYVDAIVKEALRWFPITAMGTAHAVSDDTTVAGYHVPKGAYLLPATWWLLHDPKVYPDPESFDPTRYLAPRDEPHPSIATFGFGRRMCPGRHLADTSLFLTIAQLLATFDVSRALDVNGQPMAEPSVEREPGMIGRPVAFPYRIVPRSPKHADLIKRTQLDYPWEEGDASALPDIKALHELLAELEPPSPVSA